MVACANLDKAGGPVSERTVQIAATIAAVLLYAAELTMFVLVWPMVAHARRHGALIARVVRTRHQWRVRRARQISETRQRELAQVAAAFSHDINNVFGAILSAADAADELSGEPALREVTASIVAAAEQGMASSQRMLAFGDMLPMYPVARDVNDTVTRAARQVTGLSDEVVLKLAGRPLVAVLDHDRLLACVLELLCNAREASGSAARITIQTRLVAVDTDAAQALQAAIEVVDATTEWLSRGTTLGLVERFARDAGGSLDVRTHSGEGTRVVLSLPISPDPRAPEAAHDRVHASRREKRVLVVDDNAPLRAGIVRRLRAAGFAVRHAADAAEALATTSQSFDAIITDLVLPGDMDGFALGRHFRSLDGDVALIFVSGFISARQPEVLRNDELANFLRKPIDFDNLIAVLLGLLAIREMRTPRAAARTTHA